MAGWSRSGLFVLVLAVASATLAGCGSGSPAGGARPATAPVAGAWRSLPAAPIAPGSDVVSAWTGRQMLVFGRAQPHPPWSVDVAAAYDPATRTWRELAPSKGPQGNYEGHYSAVWTGREMLVFGPLDNQAYNPATNRWRRLPRSPAPFGLGVVVWTGREAIAWGGGCCGDASSSGAAYDPARNTFRKLARSPLAPSQGPVGAWDGHELVVLVTGLDPDGKPYPASLARAAAYDPETDSWRRVAPLPARRAGATAVWDGRELLVVGGAGPARAGKPAPLARVGFAWNRATNRWRRLAPMQSGRADFAAVWTGVRLLIWGGRRDAGAGAPVIPARGLAYAPSGNRWSALPQAPLVGRLDPTAVWTGRALIVWGGNRPKLTSGIRSFADGAAFTPATS
jgi:N-acetylneuraminic acid mutarotase